MMMMMMMIIHTSYYLLIIGPEFNAPSPALPLFNPIRSPIAVPSLVIPISPICILMALAEALVGSSPWPP